MAKTIRKVRLGAKARVTLPKDVRDALGIEPGDSLVFSINGSNVTLARERREGDAPLACFSEWATDADRKGYADL